MACHWHTAPHQGAHLLYPNYLCHIETENSWKRTEDGPLCMVYESPCDMWEGGGTRIKLTGLRTTKLGTSVNIGNFIYRWVSKIASLILLNFVSPLNTPVPSSLRQCIFCNKVTKTQIAFSVQENGSSRNLSLFPKTDLYRNPFL